MNICKAVGLRISNLMIKNKLTRYALCQKICMSEQTLKHIIDERNKDIKLSTVATISEGFGLSLEEFFSDDLFKNNELL